MPLFRLGRKIDNSGLMDLFTATDGARAVVAVEVGAGYWPLCRSRRRLRLSEARRVAARTGIALDRIIEAGEILDDTDDTDDTEDGESGDAPSPTTPTTTDTPDTPDTPDALASMAHLNTTAVTTGDVVTAA